MATTSKRSKHQFAPELQNKRDPSDPTAQTSQLGKKKKTPQRLTREHHNPVTTTAMQLLQKTGAPHLVETATAADNSLSYKKKLCIQQARGVG